MVDGINQPWSFTNSLSSTYKIPKNGQVALQSCKYNLDGSILVGKNETIFYQYFGQLLTGTELSDQSTAMPIETRIGETGSIENVTTDEFALRIKDAMNKYIFHPNLVGLCQCNPKNDIITGAFSGYEFTYDQEDALVALIPNGMVDHTDNNKRDYDQWFTDNSIINWEYTASTGVFETTAHLDEEACAISKQAPLNAYNGVFEVDIQNANASDMAWGVGLSRFINTESTYAGDLTPSYYDGTRGDGNASTGNGASGVDEIYGATFNFFADFMVYRASGDPSLRVGQAVVNSDPTLTGGEETDLMFQDIPYYKNASSAFVNGTAGVHYYDIQTNASAITSIKYTLTGSQLKIEAMATATPHILLQVDIANLLEKEFCLKPVNQACQNLHPVLYIETDSVNFNNSLTISTFNGITITGYDPEYGDTPDMLILPPFTGVAQPTAVKPPIPFVAGNRSGWYATQTYYGSNEPFELEQREWNDYGDGAASPPNAIAGIDAGTNPTIQLKNVMIVKNGQGEIYGPCPLANTQGVFGFPNVSNVEIFAPGAAAPATKLQRISTSTATPNTRGNGASLYIRLGNLGQSTVNARQGNKSTIISMLPREVNVNSTGLIYYEPKNLIWLDLNNPSELTINAFDISFCMTNEQFAKSLVGQSVACLYFRPKP